MKTTQEIDIENKQEIYQKYIRHIYTAQIPIVLYISWVVFKSYHGKNYLMELSDGLWIQKQLEMYSKRVGLALSGQGALIMLNDIFKSQIVDISMIHTKYIVLLPNI